MQVTFDARALDGARHDEAALARDFAQLAPGLADCEQRDGLVTLYNDTGSHEVLPFRDELGTLVATLCFDTALALAAGRDASVAMISHPQVVNFSLDGAEVVISGDGLDGDRCALAELLPALVECGARFVALLERLYQADPARAAALARWRAALNAARAALA